MGKLLNSVGGKVGKLIIGLMDKECEKDGLMLENFLRKRYIDPELELCDKCDLTFKFLGNPTFAAAEKLLKVDRNWLSGRLRSEYGESWLRGIVSIAKGVKEFGVREPFVPASPILIVWNLTYQCNLRCKHCYENAGLARKAELNEEEARYALEQMKEANVAAIAFSGGEPLVRKDFFELAKLAHDSGMYVSMASNGTLISRKVAKKLKEVGVDYVEISLDGIGKTHDEFRGIPGAFERTLKGIKNCLAEGIDTCIATTGWKGNLEEILKVAELADKLGARFIHFNYIPVGRGTKELDITPREREELLEELALKNLRNYVENGRGDRVLSTAPQFGRKTKEIAEKLGIEYFVATHYGGLSSSSEEKMKSIKSTANFIGGCGAGRLYLALEPNGDILPCTFFPRNMKVGNILEDDLIEVWEENELLWDLRDREKLKYVEIGGEKIGCGVCENKYICGGCRARAVAYFDDPLAPDPGCIKNEKIFASLEEGVRASLLPTPSIRSR